MFTALPTWAGPEQPFAGRQARRALAWILPYLLFASASEARVVPDAPRREIECSKLPRCVAAVTSAQKAAKTDKNEAIGQMWMAYASFPDPRLLCELGRLHQQTGQLHEAANQYRRCLNSGVQIDSERLAEARAALEPTEQAGELSALRPQVSRDRAPAPLLVDSPPVAPAKSATISPKDAQRPALPVWRIILGSALVAGGLLPLGFGAAALGQNGQCYKASSAMVLMPPCLQTLNTGALGGGLLGGGLLTVAGGVLTIAIPAPRSVPIAWSLTASTAGIAAY